jgi:ankyrin repeat protein
MAFDKKEMKGNASASRADWEEESDLTIPDGYECPITGEIMQNPVMAADGHSYEKAAIEEWFRKGNHRSPLTGEKLPHRTLTVNWNLKKLITTFLAKRPILNKEKQEFADLQLAIKLREEELTARLAKLEFSQAAFDSKPVMSKQEQHEKLVRAAEKGQLAEINRLLAAGVDVDIEIKETGYTPLFAAANARDSAVFERLLGAKANVKIINNGWTLAQQVALMAPWPNVQKRTVLGKLAAQGVSLLPIHEAATLGDDKTIINERQKGQGKIKDAQASNVLHYASANGQLTVLQRFIKIDATLLQWIKIRELETAEWLLTEGGLAPQEPDKDCNTALLRAAAKGHLETVQWLLAQGGAKITEKDKYGETALLLAAANGQLETVQWLLAHGGAKITEKDNYDNTALLLAAYNGQLATVQWLLAHGGASIQEKDNSGSTALLLAAANGQLETVQWLLAQGGAKITEKSKDGETALLLAAANGQLETVQWLLAQGGAKITEKDNDGDTALLVAAHNGQLATVQWLLAHGGAKITEKDNDGETVLLVAARTGQLETVQWLLAHGGAKITEKDNDGDTALLLAAQRGQLETVQWLIAHGGASTQEKNNDGDTALLCAVMHGQLETVQWLLREGGANIAERNQQGELAIDLAETEEVRAFLKGFRPEQRVPVGAGFFSVAESKSGLQPSASIVSGHPGSSSSSTSSSSLPQAPGGGKK